MHTKLFRFLKYEASVFCTIHKACRNFDRNILAHSLCEFLGVGLRSVPKYQNIRSIFHDPDYKNLRICSLSMNT